RKLLKEGPEILNEAINLVETEDAEFVIIPGDLTKDGTQISHLKFAEHLAQIEKSGKEVFVIPGNHDILNPESYSYQEDRKIKVKNINPDEFRKIYKNYGYEQALYSDQNSLSYIAEPIEGIWLFAMDACRYNENTEGGHPVTGGKFNDQTLQWIENMLYLASKTGKSVIGFMHHGVLEHYQKQSKFFKEYVVEDNKKVSGLFASYNMKLVFTGHYHAQDISSKYYQDDKFIFDVQTGSLVTWPCPVRKVSIENNHAEINSLFITKIPSKPENFTSFAKDYVWTGIEGIAKSTLIEYKLKEEEAALLSGQIADAFVAHYQGDEISPEKAFNLKGVSLKGRFLIGFKKKQVWYLWNDTPPEDNFLKIDLGSGQILKN
ncbi:MAG: metallophosphoesterase family protein, partial [Bacteroidota bacterium]